MSMRLLEAASQGGFSRLGLARRCWLRFLRRLLEAGACEASLAARLGDISWLRLAGRCCLRLQGRSCEAEAFKALLAERACGVCVCVCLRLCIAFLVSSRDARESLAALDLTGCSGELPLALGAGLMRRLTITFPLLGCSGDLPLRWARGL